MGMAHYFSSNLYLLAKAIAARYHRKLSITQVDAANQQLNFQPINQFKL